MFRMLFWIAVFAYFPFSLIPALWRNETKWDAGMLTCVLILFSLRGIIRQVQDFLQREKGRV